MGLTGTISKADNKMFLDFNATSLTPSFYIENDSAKISIKDGSILCTSIASGYESNIYGGSAISVRDSTGDYQSNLQPPTGDNYYKCFFGQGINSVLQLQVGNNNPTIQLSNQAENIYSRSDLSSLYYNNGTIETAKLNATAGTLTLNDGTNTSVLSTSDLTFNGVSYNSDVSILQTNQLNIYNSPAIYADGRPPLTCPTASTNTSAQFGWYFKNSFSSGVNKINWYQAPDDGMVVSDLLGLYLRFFNISSISTTPNDMPFIAVYTKTDTLTPNYASWYKSRMVYIPNFIPTANTSYTTFRNISGTCPDPNSYASSLQLMINSTVAPNPAGTYAPTEEVLFFAISTSSSSVINCSEFILQKFGIMTANGTQEFNYMPLSPLP